jgi:putative SOS response-associated peptidase YedK
MCERYALPEQNLTEREFAPAKVWWKFSVRFNVGARQYVPAVRLHERQAEAVMMQWGLIPAWAEGKLDIEPPARIADKDIERSAMHREAWLKRQRCILPVAGFYVWQLTAARYRQPYFVRLIDRPVFGLAGIWDRSVTEDDDVIESCSLVCVPANQLMQNIANTERLMPAILERSDHDTWLRGTVLEARAVLRPCESQSMQAYPVSPRVNSLRADDPGLIRPTQLQSHAAV